MSGLKDRLGRLERDSAERLKGVRCANCRDWPRARILEIDVDGNQSWADPAVPVSCPRSTLETCPPARSPQTGAVRRPFGPGSPSGDWCP